MRQLSERDTELIVKIADRAQALAYLLDAEIPDRIKLIVNLAMAHRHMPLDLFMLLSAPDTDFVHDVWGILRHIDKETGAMRDCFVPRTARFQHTTIMDAG